MAEWKKVIVSGSAPEFSSITLDSPLGVAQGGTALASYTQGDILYATGTTTLAKLGIGSANQVLQVNAGATAPEWVASTVGDVTAISIATNGGLVGTSLTGPVPQLSASINAFAAGTVNVANDSIAFLDAGDNLSKKESIADFVSGIAGTNITASSGQLNVDYPSLAANLSGSIFATVSGDVLISAAGVATIQADSVALGTDTTGNYVQSLANATNGGTTITNGTAEGGAATVALNINDLSAAVVDVANDFIAIEDADDNSTKKESIADLIAAIDGTGLTATSGVLAVDYGSSAGDAVEGNTTITVNGTTNEVEITGTSAQALGGGPSYTIGLPNDVTIGNDLTVTGDLEVSGTASFKHSQNLDIADKFITLASGSTSATDGGIVVAQTFSGAKQIGFAYGMDVNAGGVGRWGITASFSNDSGALIPKDFAVSVTASTATPSLAPTYGGSAGGYGNMYVDTNNEDIYIWV